MADADDFKADELDVQEAADKTQVRLVWGQDSGAHRVVVLERSQLPQVFAQLQTQIAAGSGASINLAALQSGLTIAVTGLGFGPRQDHFRLTAFVELPEQGRGVTIPLRFSKKDVEGCVKAMTRWLETQP